MPLTSSSPAGGRRQGRVEVALDDAGLADLLTAIDTTPLAAAALALLLRGQANRSVEEGLVAESTTYSMLQAGPEFRAWRASRPPRPVADEPDPVDVERDGDVLRITLRRPGRHNAVNQARMRDGLAHALGLALADASVAAVQLRGEGPSFSSGGDLDEFGSFPDPATSHLSRLARSPARLAAALGPRLTVHLHGACMGAGIEVPAFAGHGWPGPMPAWRFPRRATGWSPGGRHGQRDPPHRPAPHRLAGAQRHGRRRARPRWRGAWSTS